MVIEIPLTKGKVALIDDEDYALVAPIKWHASLTNGIWYANGTDSDGRRIRMHNLIMPSDGNRTPDHKDGDGLNNVRSNLRLATASQQMMNRRAQSNNRSGFKGVDRHWRGRSWRAQTQAGGRTISRCCFDTAEQAARAYDELAREHFGEFARVNFPDD